MTDPTSFEAMIGRAIFGNDAEKELQALSKACPWFGKCEEHDDLKAAIEKYKATKK